MKTIYSSLTALLLMLSFSSVAQTSVTTDIQADFANENSTLALGARYYYYPNLDAYYDSTDDMYVFESNEAKGQILKAKQIPTGYRGYSLFNGTRVAITDYDGDEPFSKITEHRKLFPKKYTSKRQPPKKIIVDKNLACN